MNNKLIGECRNCQQMYCMECTEHDHWEGFCSDNCYDEYIIILTKASSRVWKPKNEK